MNYVPWIGLALWVAGILVQIGVGRISSRLASLEEWRKLVEMERRTENVEVRLQLIEQLNALKPRKDTRWQRS